MKNSESSSEEGGDEKKWPVKLSAFEVRPTVHGCHFSSGGGRGRRPRGAREGELAAALRAEGGARRTGGLQQTGRGRLAGRSQVTAGQGQVR